MQSDQKSAIAQDYLTSGNQLRQAGKIDQAIEQYQQALLVNPDFVPALAQLAELYESQKDIDSAINCLQKIIQIEPENTEFISQLTAIYSASLYKKNDLNEVIKIYQELLQNPQIKQKYIIHQDLGQTIFKISIRQGNCEQAIAFFQDLIDTYPNHAWLYYNLALNLAKNNQLDQAINCYQKAIQLHPEFWKALIETARLLEKKGEHEQASQYRIKALKIKPNLPIPYLKLVNPHSPEEWELMKKTFQENIDKKVDIGPRQYLRVGHQFGRQGDFPEAISYYQKSIYKQLSKSRPEYVNQYWESGTLQDPNFLMIGVAKCGTTSLYDYICQHPQFLPAAQKESHYLKTLVSQIKTIEEQQDWSLLNQQKEFYLAHFPPRPEESSFVTGEASTTNIFPGVEKIISHWFPKIKLIIIFRNPVKRVISQYNQMLKRNRPDHSLEQMLTLEIDQLEAIKEPEQMHLILQSRQQMILRPGLYIYILERWMKCFPRNQFLILSNEDLAQDPAGVMKQVFDFLGLPENNAMNYIPRNVGHYPKDIDPNLLSRLQAFYQPYNQRLEEFLGRKFNWD